MRIYYRQIKSWLRHKLEGGYKYELERPYCIGVLGVVPKKDVHTQYIDLRSDSILVIRAGYQWDGPSGPSVDTETFMRGSLVHDALYQLMKEKHIDCRKDRKIVDQLLRVICLEDGMLPIRAYWVYLAVRVFGGRIACRGGA